MVNDMKNRKCPNHKSCWDYGSCEDCELGKEIARLHKRIDRFKRQNEKWEETCTELTQCCTKLETIYKIECKRVDTIKADTVRKMRDRLKNALPSIADVIDYFANELLEESDET